MAEDERVDAEEFVARVLVQIPDPRRHLVRYYGAYSNRARGQRRKAEAQLEAHPCSETSQQAVPTPPERAALRRRWANLIRRILADRSSVRDAASTCAGGAGKPAFLPRSPRMSRLHY